MRLISKILLVASASVYYIVIPLAYLVTYWQAPYEFMDKGGTVLVTGGAGYIGSHTVVELLKSNYDIVVIDNLINCYAEDGKKPESLQRVEKITGKTITFYKVDLRDQQELDSIFKKHTFDSVIHFAGLKAVGESVAKPLLYYDNNISGTSMLLQVMQTNRVKKIVFSSSATVYGTPEFLPLTEQHPVGQSCTNPYGKTKYFIEEILKDLCKADKEWRAILLRYFNPVGAHGSGSIGEDPNGIPNNLMPFIAQVAVGRRELVQVFGSDYDTPDGTGVRDYIHIWDLAIGHIKALQKLNSTGFSGAKAYNLGTGRGYSVLEMIQAFSKASGRKIRYEIVGRRGGDVAASYADPALAREELDWVATKGIDDMCVDTWRWQSTNSNGYKSK